MKLAAGNLLEHVRQYAGQCGVPLREALEKYGLEEPEVPPGGEPLWQWFWELSAGRRHNGFAPPPVSWADMDAWARISGIALQPWQARILRAMDAAWLEAAEAARSKLQGK